MNRGARSGADPTGGSRPAPPSALDPTPPLAHPAPGTPMAKPIIAVFNSGDDTVEMLARA
jgi:hypothetical protein